MKNNFVFSVLLFSMTFVGSLSAQWTKTKGLPGGDFSHFAQVGDTTFALHGAGIYFSTNSGLSWQNLLVKRYDADPSLRLIRSNDAGQSWLPMLVPDSLSFRSQVVAGQWVLISTSDGTFRTGDDGATWEFVGGVDHLQFDGHRVFGNDATSLVASDDFGQTWQPLTNVKDVTDILVKDSVIMVLQSGSANRVTVSKNNGQTWQVFSPNIGFGQMYNAVFHKGEVYGFWGPDIWKTSDFGKTWTETVPANLYVIYNGISVGDGLLVGGTANGIFRSTDGGNSWATVNHGLLAQSPNRLRAFGKHLFATGREGIYRLAADDENWELQQVNIPLNHFFMAYSDYLEVGTEQFVTFGFKPWASSDGGTTWVESTSNDPAFYDIERLEAASNKVIGWPLFPDFDYYASNDNGRTFQRMASLPGPYIFLMENDNGILSALSVDNRLYQSSDGGDNWTVVGASVPIDWLGSSLWLGNGLLLVRDNLVVIFNSRNDNPPYATRALFSKDLGQTWQMLDSATPGYPWGSSVFQDLVKANGYLIAATAEGVFYSSDSGSTWAAWNEGFENRVASRLCVHGKYLFASLTSDGVWKRPLADLASLAAKQPDSAESLAIFPNPASERFTIETNGEGGGLTVQETLGRIVFAEKIGAENVEVSCENWPTGIYHVAFWGEKSWRVGRVAIQK